MCHKLLCHNYSSFKDILQIHHRPTLFAPCSLVWLPPVLSVKPMTLGTNLEANHSTGGFSTWINACFPDLDITMDFHEG